MPRPGAPARPLLEGTVAVRDGRRLSFAEFGAPHGPTLIWMHGTPGARRQIPQQARRLARERGVRLIGIDRPGIGTSTAHLYRDVVDWTADLRIFLDTRGIDDVSVAGLSGGGPYALAAGAGLPERVRSVGVLGGVAPTVGDDAISGGLIQLAVALAPLIRAGRVPLGAVLTRAVRLAHPIAGPVIDTYARFQPEGDRLLLGVPEFRAMFLDDLVNGSRFQLSAPVHDLLLFTRHWGFALAEVGVPVRWWHGDGDHIVPHAHGVHAAGRVPGAVFETVEGASHLGGLGIADEVLSALLELP